jgi:anti-sigma factor RsiW
LTCERWAGKLDAYLDGELSADEQRALDEHLRQCPACTAESLGRLQQKRAIHAAGQRFVPDAAFRTRIQRSITAGRPSPWKQGWLPAVAIAAVLLIASAFLLNLNRERRSEQQLMSELADLHVATLASSNPVDVVSTDRHTVKPWFEGKLPFTFNLPELQDSPFVLVGGRVSYLNQSPGAELIYRVRQHQISVFIFQDRELRNIAGDKASTALSFAVRSWRHNGLRYFVIGDASAQDMDKLSELLKAAG